MKLADIVDVFIAGDWGNESLSNDTPNAVFCIRGADIMSIRDHKYTDIPKRYISKRAKETKLLKVGDLVIEKSGGSPIQSTGRITYISEDLIQAKKELVCSNFSIGIRVKSRWNPLYVYYYWQYIYNLGVFFNFESKTSGIKNLQLDSVLEAIAIEEISLEVQNQIVATLSSYDHKIALNRAINHNLVAMAKQLYDYWFVQFDFPNEEGKPYKSSGGKMVWNQKLKKEIPKEWDSSILSEISDITMGQSPEGSSYNEKKEGIIFYQGSADFGAFFPSIRQYTTSPIRFAMKGDVLMSVRAPVGIVNIANNDCCIGRGLVSLRSKDSSTLYIYYLLKQLDFVFQKRNINGTTFGSITKDDLSQLPIIKPCKEIIVNYEKICSSIFNKLISIDIELCSLTKQRDELLPLLMNGQVTVG